MSIIQSMDRAPFETTRICDILCGEIYFSSIGDMEIHCTLCGCIYNGFPEYKSHTTRYHNRNDCNEGKSLELYTEEDDDLIVVLEDDDGSEYSFIVDFESDCEEPHSEESGKKPFSINRYTCDALQKQNNSAVRSDRHLERQSSVSDILCKLHTESGRKPRRINRRRFKPKDIRFMCPHCDYAGNDRTNFINHVKRHFDNKPYKCIKCSKTFYTRSELNSHLVTHSGERLHLCHYCGHAFPSRAKLTIHLKRHLYMQDKNCETSS